MDYYATLEKEIATENLVSSIVDKVMSIIKFIIRLIQQAIDIITRLIGKLKRNKTGTNQDATPNTMKGAGAEVMTNGEPTPTVTADAYDCGNEVTRVVDDIEICVEMLIKRPLPDHTLGKGYIERWAGDNEFIADRIAKVNEVLDKLDEIENKTLTIDVAETLKTRLQKLKTQYEKYSRIYGMYVKKHPHTEVYLASTRTSFDIIANASNRVMKMFPQIKA